MSIVYSFADVNGNSIYVDDSGDFNYTGTWSSGGTYDADTLDAVTYGAALYMCIIDNIGDNPRRTPTTARPATWSIMSLLYEYSSSGSSSGTDSTAQDAYDLAVTGTNIAWDAYWLAQIGTNTGSAAYDLAGSAYYVGTEAYALAGSAYDLASIAYVVGTDAQARADAAYYVGTDAYNLAGSAAADAALAQSTANGAFTIAVAGTNAAASAQATGDAAYALAMIGTNTGTAALGAAATAQSVADAAFAMAQIGTVMPFLTQLQDVNVPVPQAQQVLLYNGSVWIAGDAAADVVSPGAFNFFLEGTNSGTETYLTLATEPSGGPEQTASASVGASNQFELAEDFISFSADRDHINAGIWRFATYASVDVQNRTAYAVVEMWVRGIDGTETMLFSGTSEPINSSTPTLYLTVLSRGSYATAVTDKLVAKYYFTRASNPPATVTLYYAGAEHASLIASPIILEHNDLGGIQGGVFGEHYHITEAQSTALPATITSAATSQGILSVGLQGTLTVWASFTEAGSNQFQLTFINGILQSAALA